MHRATRIGIDAHTCRRLYRLQRRTGTPVRKLVNALLRDFLDATTDRRKVRPPRRSR
jgi:hypothetical protein